MNSRRLTLSGALLALGVLAVVLSGGCNGTPTGQTSNATYQLNGLVVADYSVRASASAIDFTKESARLPRASITLGGTAFEFARLYFPIDSVFSLASSSPSTFTKGSYTLIFQDSTLMTDSATVSVPDTFSLLTTLPDTMRGPHNATLTWSGATGATGYVMAAVHRGQAYIGTGHSYYATTLNTAGVIPQEAFMNNLSLDTGWYYIFVYAYTGVPDSSLSRSLLPVTFPTQLADNIALTKVAGHIGAVVVAHRDSILVKLQ
jgi:hypothetical protein